MAAANLVTEQPGAKKELKVSVNSAIASTASLVEAAVVSVTGATGVEPGDRVVDVYPVDQSAEFKFMLTRWIIPSSGTISLYFRRTAADTGAFSSAELIVIVEKAPAQY